MTPTEFVASVRTSIVEESQALYRDVFESSSAATDPYWIRALSLYSTLSADQQQILFEIMRQVSVDTCSHLMGVLDGTSAFSGPAGEFELRHDGQVLNRDLQDLLLEAEQGAR